MHPSPVAVLSTCRRFLELGEPILYRQLLLCSTSALRRCAHSANLRHTVRAIEVQLAGGEVGSGQMAQICAILYRHLNEIAPGTRTWKEHVSLENRLQLDSVKLCMNVQSSPAKDDVEFLAFGLIKCVLR